MVYKSFYLNIVLRVIGMLLFCFCIAFFVSYRKETIPVIFLGLLLSWLLISLIKFLNRTNKKLESCLNAYIANDFSVKHINEDHPVFQSLYNKLNTISEHEQILRLRYEVQDQLYKSIIDNAPLGILCYDDEGRIMIANHRFKSLLSQPDLLFIHQIKHSCEKLLNSIIQLEPGIGLVYHDSTNFTNDVWLLNKSLVRIQQREINIIFFSDVKRPLEQKELESWEKLTRTIVHEVMNSIAPLTSLTDTLLNYFANPSMVENMNEKLLSRTLLGLGTIKDRGEELTHFVERVRRLNTIPQPVPQPVSILGLVQSVHDIMDEELKLSSVEVDTSSINDFTIMLDKGLIKHVLINVFKNAIDAMINCEIKILRIAGFTIDNFYHLNINDSGVGIPAELMDQLFVPFFTTKEKGSGIGLFLCRTIMNAHNGEINFSSVQDKGSTVILKFPVS